MPARLLTTRRPSARTAERSFVHTAQLTLFDFAFNGAPIASAPHEPEPATRLASAAGNYRITPDDRIGQRGPRQKADDNLRAIRRLLELEADGRRPTCEDQAVLVRFVGWGSLSQVFVENHAAWGRVGAELRRLLGREDYEKAEASTPNATTPRGR